MNLISNFILILMTLNPNQVAKPEFFVCGTAEQDLLARFSKAQGIETSVAISGAAADMTFYCSEKEKQKLLKKYAEEMAVTMEPRKSEGFILKSKSPIIELTLSESMKWEEFFGKFSKRSLVSLAIKAQVKMKRILPGDKVISFSYQVRPWIDSKLAKTECIAADLKCIRDGHSVWVPFCYEG